jgi:hypothetical protein
MQYSRREFATEGALYPCDVKPHGYKATMPFAAAGCHYEPAALAKATTVAGMAGRYSSWAYRLQAGVANFKNSSSTRTWINMDIVDGR